MLGSVPVSGRCYRAPVLSLLRGLGLGCLACRLDGEGLMKLLDSIHECVSLSTMARPQNREADNRARSGRQGRTNGKPSVAQQVSRVLFGPSDSRVSQAGVGGYKSAVVKAAQAIVGKAKPYYGVHGSPVSGLKNITPRVGSSSAATNRAVAGAYGKAAVPGPSVYSFPAKSAAASGATGYGRGGSVYVAKVGSRSVSTPVWNTAERITSQSMKVVKEIPASVTDKQLAKLVGRAVAKDRAITAAKGVGAAAAAGGAGYKAAKRNKNKGSGGTSRK